MTTDTTNDEKPSAAETVSGPKEFDWFDRPKSRRLLWKLLWGACIVTILLEIPLIIAGKRHSHFEHAAQGDVEHAADAVTATASHVPTFDGWWFFYPVFSFVGCALMVIVAKGLGFILKRPDDYYIAEEKTLPEDIDESLR